VRTKTTREMVGAFRGWMVERPLSDVVSVVGFDRHGRRVATAVPSVPGFEFATADTCTPFPFP
jgi:hypothetical protein